MRCELKEDSRRKKWQRRLPSSSCLHLCFSFFRQWGSLPWTRSGHSHEKHEAPGLMTTSMSGNHLYKARRTQIKLDSEEIVTGKDGGHVFVYNQTKETFLAFRVKVADTVLGRMTGLLGKKSLNPDSGLWIVPANAVHTIGMLFAFDLVLIDKDFRVVGTRELVRPLKITRPNFRAESVLELPAHTIFRSRTEVGDQLVIERYEAKKRAQSDLEESG